MTTPTLTADGYMPWAPRDWLESVCARQPDGSWLVQAPPAGEEPQLCLLPDDAAQQSFLSKSTRPIWADVALFHWSAPAATLPLMWIMLPVPWSMLLPREVSAWLPFLMIRIVGLVGALLPFVLVNLRRNWQSSLAAWLAEVAVTPAAGATPPGTTVRTPAEWQAMVLSNGLRGERALTLGMIWMTLALMAYTPAAYLNLCRGVGSLDPMVPERARERARAWSECGIDGGLLVAAMGTAPFAVVVHVVILRRRRMARARLVLLDRTA